MATAILTDMADISPVSDDNDRRGRFYWDQTRNCSSTVRMGSKEVRHFA